MHSMPVQGMICWSAKGIYLFSFFGSENGMSLRTNNLVLRDKLSHMPQPETDLDFDNLI